MRFIKSSKQSKGYWVWGIVVGALVPVIGHYDPKLFGAVIAISFSVILAFGVSYVISTWYIKRRKFNERILKILYWVNLFAWIIPDLGLIVSMLTNQINFQNHGKDRRKYMLLGSLGISLSLLHFIAKLAHLTKW